MKFINSFIFTVIILIINVYGQVGKPEIKEIIKIGDDIQVTPINDLDHDLDKEDSLYILSSKARTVYYIVGDESNKENPLILTTAQNARSIVKVMLEAMQDFVYNKNIYGKLEISSWGTEKICDDETVKNDSNLCPSVALQGTTNFAYRYTGKEVISLDDYFEKYMIKNNTIFSTQFMKQAEYDYSIDGKYVAVPLITDIRMMYYNKTTFNAMNLSPPPRNNLENWTWDHFIQKVKEIDKYFEDNGIEENPFDFYGLYDEEMKFLSVILRNYGVPIISSSQRCGLTEEKSGINLRNNTINALEQVVSPLFNILKNHNHDWCTIRNKEFLEWLNNKDGNMADDENDDYIKLKDVNIECENNKPSVNNHTSGIIFASPPEMAGATIDDMESDIKEALVPGGFSCK